MHLMLAPQPGLLSLPHDRFERVVLSIFPHVVLLFALVAITAFSTTHAQETAMDAADVLLSQRASDDLKNRVCSQWKSHADEVLKKLVAELPVDNGDEEYRRIPWIWKLSIDATRNEVQSPGMVLKLLDIATPELESPLRDWQAVVIGGAVINGLSLNGLWPDVELKKLLQNAPQLKERLDRAVQLAVVMGDDPKIRTGTRYDAIRMVALQPIEEAIPWIQSFLKPKTDDELQMGAVSALSDIQSHRIIAPLLRSLETLSEGNRTLAIEALHRTPVRSLAYQVFRETDRQQRVAQGLPIEEESFVAKPLTVPHAFTPGIEGPVGDSEGNVFVVNFEEQQTIGRVDVNGLGEVFMTLPGTSTGNGIVFDPDGNMLIADYVEHKIWKVELGSKKLTVFFHDPAMNQPNDLAIAPNGTLFASDPDWMHSRGQVWCIDQRGKGRVVAADMGTTNGIDVSPDGKWLYVNESVQRKIWRFTIQADGSLSDKKLFKEFPDHGFDGMRCDADGNLYVTRYGKGTVVVLRPSGEILREIDVLGAKPSNLCFGGVDGRTVTVTEVEHGRLVRFRTDVPGRSHRLFPQTWINDACRWIEEGEGEAVGMPPPKAFSDTDWMVQRESLRDAWLKFLGPMPDRIATPLTWTEVQPEENRRSATSPNNESTHDDVLRSHLRVEVERGVFMDAIVLRPRRNPNPGKPMPGLVALHPTVKETIDEISGVTTRGPRAIGWHFAKQGYVVVCPQCFLWQDVSGFQEAVQRHRDAHPNTLGMAKMLFDAQRAVDLLFALPDVDQNRIGAIGHSLGAKEVLYLMAFDDRIGAGVASEGGIAFASTNWDAPWYLGPSDRGALNHAQLLELIAPRPLLIMGGEVGPGAADGSQSMPVLRDAASVWRSRSPLSRLGIWNHRSGHVFEDEQLRRSLEWFESAWKTKAK